MSWIGYLREGGGIVWYWLIIGDWVLFGVVVLGLKNIVLAQSWHKVGTKNEVK